jgi:uncharacterized protein (TIGR04255 family)
MAKMLLNRLGKIILEVKFGDYDLRSEPFSLRVEMRRVSLRHIVQLAAPATASMVDGTQREGLLVDIDSICEHTTTDLTNFVGELPDRAEEIHTRNKDIFFELLTPETLAYLGPSYEPVSD